jgi:L-fuculose-phosphate aldolase
MIRLFQEIGRRLDARGLIASNDGNLSTREDDGTFLVTATGARKGYLRPDEVVRVDTAGRLLSGGGAPSSETDMHLAIYLERPDIRAIVHAHPPVATGFSVAREPMESCVLPEIILTLGSVPLAPYGTPGTQELGRNLAPHFRDRDAVLLTNHGAVTVGPDLEEAYFRMERLEHTARILLTARLLGRVESLDRPEVERLLATAPGAGDELPCRPGSGSRTESSEEANRRLVAVITEVLEGRGLPHRGKES